VHALLAEEAARSLAPGVVQDAVVRFITAARVGPAQARAEIVGRADDRVVVRAEVRDLGAGDRVCSLTMLTIRPGW
jgi:acyl-coenzyme A thioesterase PaaI-like protein